MVIGRLNNFFFANAVTDHWCVGRHCGSMRLQSFQTSNFMKTRQNLSSYMKTVGQK